MRVVFEENKGNCKTTIFTWNDKFQVKIEVGSMSQEYKIPSEKAPGGLDQVRSMLTNKFYETCLTQFEGMKKNFIEAYLSSNTNHE